MSFSVFVTAVEQNIESAEETSDGQVMKVQVAETRRVTSSDTGHQQRQCDVINL